MTHHKGTSKTIKSELLSSSVILPEVEWRLIKGEPVDVIIGKKDIIYIDPETRKESDISTLKEKLKKRYKPNLKGKDDAQQARFIDKMLDEYKRVININEIKSELEKRLKSKKFMEIEIYKSDFFLSVKLLPRIIREIAGEVEGKPGIVGISRIWLNKKISMMLDVSNKTIKSEASKNVFNVKGEDIAWAVIDTGIALQNSNISTAVVERYDFTGEGVGDKNGHGTHVAGIIASRSKRYPGIAPAAKLYEFKVLNANGEGNQFAVIQAMEKIRKINNDNNKIIIQGANISLGASPEVGSYGIGAHPICQGADRLVDSGVIVCVAAGNDGHKVLATFNGATKVEYFRTFMDLTISDPGNAEKVITVGSVHKENPHTYGISYFSAKGPTGDGRYKPDVVAPGEKIKSLGLGEDNEEDGVEMSGTSMATPHVSGAIALFLSVYKEFIGKPQKVKEILMRSCTDLGRDKYFQGAGLIDVLRTMQAV